jgi:hypothetical protein
MSIGRYSHAKLVSIIKQIHDQRQSDTSGDITGVTAGNGLSGGGSSGDVSLALDIAGATDGTGITLQNSDFLLIADATDNNNVKKVNISQLTAASASPAGSTTQVQFNDAGSFGASANFVFNSTTNTLTVSKIGPFTAAGNIDFDNFDMTNVDINSGRIDNTSIGSSTPADGTFSTAKVTDLTDNRVVIVGTGGELEDDGNLIFNGTQLKVGVTISGSSGLQVVGNTIFGGDLSVSGTVRFADVVAGNTTLSSVTVSDLTDNRVVIAGAAGSLEDDANLIFNGSALKVSALISGSSDLSIVGSTAIGGALSVTGAVTLPGIGTGAGSGPQSYLALNSSGLVVLTSSVGGSGGGSTSNTVSQGGGTTISGVDTFVFSSSVVTDDGGGQVTVKPVIGAAEDGDYTDGLYTDFTTSTPIGTPIDRFNELFKILAPSPAPALSRANYISGDGATAKLSFGSSQPVADYTSSATAAGFSAVDINGSYSPSESGNNFRIGVLDGSEHVTGTLNFTVGPNSSNGNLAYASGAFGNAETGNLKLELNGTVIHTVDLSSFVGIGNPATGTAQSLTSNSGFINVSNTASSFDGNGSEWYIFKHRTANYKVDSSNQKVGWNYARAIHTIGGTDYATNYVEWINDPSGSTDDLAVSSPRIENVTLVGSKFLSGVEYNTDATAKYKADILNMYRNVYPASGTPISFSVTNSSTPSSQAVPTIDTSGGENNTKVLGVTASLDYNSTSLLSGAITANLSATHPLKANISNTGSATTGNGFLIDNRTLNSTNLIEYFHDESFRKASASYDTQGSISAASSIWNSENHMTGGGAAGHTDGLLLFNQRLYSPIDADIPNSGDFSSLLNVEAGQPNYSGVTGTRTFYRVLTNSSGVSKRDFKITSTKVSTTYNNSALGTSNVHFYAKIPGSTGWMDISQNFAYGSVQDNDGALIAGASNDVDSGNNVHHITFGTASVANNELVMLKIEADESWDSYISQLQFQLGATTNTATQAPALDDIDANDSGESDAKLSFGSSNAVASYSNATGSSIGLSNFDSNDLYSLSGDRRGVFGSKPTLDGELNEDVSSNGNNYPANAFANAYTGSLVLVVNGIEVHSVDLNSTLSAISNDFNSNDSGFSVSSVDFSTTTDSIPDYTKPYRTVNYQVG